MDDFKPMIIPTRKDDRPNPFRRKHIRDVALHVDVETKEMLRNITPKDLTNDDQRLLYLIHKARR